MERPEKRSAINSAMARELQQAFIDFENGSQRAAVLAGSGNEAFTGGADLHGMPEFWRIVPGVGIHTAKSVIVARTTLMVRKMDDSADKLEGLNAFLEKRPPGYTGK